MKNLLSIVKGRIINITGVGFITKSRGNYYYGNTLFLELVRKLKKKYGKLDLRGKKFTIKLEVEE